MRAQLLRFAVTLPGVAIGDSRLDADAAGLFVRVVARAMAPRSRCASSPRCATGRAGASACSCPSAPRPSSSASAGAARGTRSGSAQRSLLELVRPRSDADIRPLQRVIAIAHRAAAALRGETGSPRRGPSRATAAATGPAPAERADDGCARSPSRRPRRPGARQTWAISSSRVKTSPGWRARNASRSNSRRRTSTTRPPTSTRRRATSIVSSPIGQRRLGLRRTARGSAVRSRAGARPAPRARAA